MNKEKVIAQVLEIIGYFCAAYILVYFIVFFYLLFSNQNISTVINATLIIFFSFIFFIGLICFKKSYTLKKEYVKSTDVYQFKPITTLRRILSVVFKLLAYYFILTYLISGSHDNWTNTQKLIHFLHYMGMGYIFFFIASWIKNGTTNKLLFINTEVTVILFIFLGTLALTYIYQLLKNYIINYNLIGLTGIIKGFNSADVVFMVTPVVLIKHALELKETIQRCKQYDHDIKQVEEKKKEISTLNEQKEFYKEYFDKVIYRTKDSEVSNNIFNIQNAVSNIFGELLSVEDNSNDRIANRFITYYLPTTQKLLDTYIKLDASSLITTKMKSTKDNIKKAIVNIKQGFLSLYETMLLKALIDVEAEITALDNIMTFDGLIKDKHSF